MGGGEMSGGKEVIAFQRDKHTFHMAPCCVIIYCPIGHVLPPLNVFIFLNIFFIYFLWGHCAEEMILKSNIWRASWLPGCNLCSISVEKRGPWCPGAAISFPAVTFLTGCLQDTGTQPEPHASRHGRRPAHCTVDALTVFLRLLV